MLARRVIPSVVAASLPARVVVTPVCAVVASRAPYGLRASSVLSAAASRAPPLGVDVTVVHGVPVRGIRIEMEPTPNPDSAKFVPEGKEVLPSEFGSGIHFSSLDDAAGSAMVRQLLTIAPVRSVFLGPDFITVNKTEDAEWGQLRPLVLGAIMDAYQTGQPLITEVTGGTQGNEAHPDDSEVVLMIKELLDTRIRPTVQEHGGDIFYVDFIEDTGVVQLRLAGSCVGCATSTVTLYNGVESMLMHYIPEVSAIEQVEDEELQKVGVEAFETFEARLKAAGVPDVADDPPARGPFPA